MLNKELLKNIVTGTHMHSYCHQAAVIGTHYSNVTEDVTAIKNHPEQYQRNCLRPDNFCETYESSSYSGMCIL
jgi:hypothetical protein